MTSNLTEMKTTENISLGGYSFTVESDAYNELDIYLTDIRNCFREDANADEIVEDIEVRIAELLGEKCVPGMVANLQMVREIKERIGDPKVLAQEEGGSEAEPAEEAQVEKQEETPGKAQERAQGKPQQKTPLKERRLYRDIDGRIVGGVCGGLGAYFGIDKVLFRIIFLLLFFIGFVGIDDGPYCMISVAAYVCLWIAMPGARTVEEKCRMKGKPMNLEGFRSKESNFEKEVKDFATSPVGRTAGRAGKVFLGIILLLCGLTGLLACIFIPSVPELIQNHITDWNALDSSEFAVAQILTGTTFWGLILVTCGILFIWFLYNGIMLLFDLKTPRWKPGLVLIIAWFISIFAVAAWCIKITADLLPVITL